MWHLVDPAPGELMMAAFFLFDGEEEKMAVGRVEGHHKSFRLLWLLFDDHSRRFDLDVLFW